MIEINFTKEEFDEHIRLYTNGTAYRIGHVRHHNFLWFYWSSVEMDLSYSECVEVYDSIVTVASRLNEYFKSRKRHLGDWVPMTYGDLTNALDKTCIKTNDKCEQ